MISTIHQELALISHLTWLRISIDNNKIYKLEKMAEKRARRLLDELGFHNINESAIYLS